MLRKLQGGAGGSRGEVGLVPPYAHFQVSAFVCRERTCQTE